MLIPFIQYADARQAIAWLGQAFGFKPHLIVPGENDSIVHSQLLMSNKAMLMVSSAKDWHPAQGKANSQAANTSGIYVVVVDPDAHYHQAKLAGAEIVMDIEDQDYGGRAYTCLDLEGNVWSFGSYDPFAEIG